MRIAQLAPLCESVPPRAYGGTERVVHALVEALVRQGHEVTLLASGDSITSACLVPVVPEALWNAREDVDPIPFHVLSLGRLLRIADEFDVVHSHLDYLTFPVADLLRPPVVTTMHGRLDQPEMRHLFDEFPSVPVVSISNSQRQPVSHARWVATVYHGLPADQYPFQSDPGTHLVWLGRLSPEKGLERAVRVAELTGLPLKVAARPPLSNPTSRSMRVDWEYYHQVVAPLLKHHPLVEYVGELRQEDKPAFFRGALALLFPIDWPEPFGLVLIEALAFGVPVIARPVGSVPEIIDDGVTGFLCDSVEEMALACQRVARIDRSICRAVFEQRFTAATMASRYEAVYRRLLDDVAERNEGGEQPTVSSLQRGE